MILFKNNKPAKSTKSSFSPLNSVVHWSFKRIVCHQGSLTFFRDTVAAAPQGWELESYNLGKRLWAALNSTWHHGPVAAPLGFSRGLFGCCTSENFLSSKLCFLNTFQPVLMTVGLFCNYSMLLRLYWWSILGKTIVPARKEVYSNGSPSNQVWVRSPIFYCPALSWIFSVPLLDVQSCLLLSLKYKRVMYGLIFLRVPQQAVCLLQVSCYWFCPSL